MAVSDPPASLSVACFAVAVRGEERVVKFIFSTQDEAAAQQLKKRRTFRKFTYRGVDLDQLLDMNYEQLMGLVGARARRRFSRGEYGDHIRHPRFWC